MAVKGVGCWRGNVLLAPVRAVASSSLERQEENEVCC